MRTRRGRTTRSIIKLYPLEVQADSDPTDADLQKNSTGSEEPLIVQESSLRKAAFVARDAITAQLIHASQD